MSDRIAVFDRGRVRLSPPAISDAAELQATVIDVTYLGADRRVELDSDIGPLVARLPAGTDVPPLGSAVTAYGIRKRLRSFPT